MTEKQMNSKRSKNKLSINHNADITINNNIVINKLFWVELRSKVAVYNGNTNQFIILWFQSISHDKKVKIICKGFLAPIDTYFNM